MAHFEDLSDAADELIRDNGEVIAIRRRTVTIADPAKSWEEGTQTVADTTTEAVFLDNLDGYVAPTLTHQATRTALIAGKDLEAVSFVPNLDDRIVRSVGTASEEEWEITSIVVEAPDGQALLYTMTLVRKNP